VKGILTSASALTVACALSATALAQAVTAGVAVPQPQPAAPSQAPEPENAAPCCKVPILTPVELEFVDPASSRTSKSGDLIAMRLAEPLIVDGRQIAPAGTKAIAEVIQASKAGMMGKAGELTFAARYVEIGETRLPLKRFGYGRSQGSDPSGTLNTLNVAAAVAMPIASVALMFVSGGNVDIKPGARAHAVVATETLVPVETVNGNQQQGK
jgi:hypothetical protein